MQATIRELTKALHYWSAECLIRDRSIERIAELTDWRRSPAAPDALALVAREDLDALCAQRPAGNYLLFWPDAPDGLAGWPGANLLCVRACPDAALLRARVGDLLVGSEPMPAPAEVLLNALCWNRLQATLDAGAQLLGNPLAAFDTSLGLLGCAPAPTDAFRAWEQEGAGDPSRQVVQTRRLIDKLCESSLPFFSEPDSGVRRRIYAPVQINGVVVAFCVVEEVNTVFAREDLALAGQIAQAVSLELQKNDIYKSKTGLVYEYFLIKLIENSAGNREFVEMRMRNLDLRVTDSMYVVSFRFLEEPENPRRIRTVSKELRELLQASLSAVYNDHFVALVIRDKPPMLSPARREDLERFLAANHLIGGVSFRFGDLSRTHTYYRQSLDAIGVGKLMRPREKLHRLRDLTVFELFSICNLSLDLRDYVLPELRQLRDYDQAHQTELCRTLHCYLQCGMNSGEATRRLHIHRNTLLYRIDKIREITGLRWEGNTVLDLMLSFRLLEYLARADSPEALPTWEADATR